MTRLSRLSTSPWWRDLWFLGLTLLGTALVMQLILQGQGRTLVWYALLIPFCAVALSRPEGGIILVFCYLIVSGAIRRALIPSLGWSSQDPLLLIGPSVAVLLVIIAVPGRRIRLDTSLSRWILALMLVMAVEVANPLQGSLRIGLAGALFYLVPLLWFWIGRFYATPELIEYLFYRVMMFLVVAAALWGFYQTFFGLLPFEEQWVEVAGYAALHVRGYIRPISFFTSASEYSYFLAICLALLWAGWLKQMRVGTLLMPPLALALFLEGSRGIVVITLFAGALLWTIQGQSRPVWLPRLIFAMVIGASGLYWSVSQAEPTRLPPGRIRALVEHQVGGLLNPFDPRRSTAASHGTMFLYGLSQGLVHPLGSGLGATTLAAGKFGGVGTSTEVDLSNLFISLGIPGGVTYFIVICLVLVKAFGFWHRTRSLIALAILGVLTVGLGQWLNGGNYGMSALFWFSIGSLDRLSGTEADENRHRHS